MASYAVGPFNVTPPMWRGVVPNLVLMGRRGERVAALVRDVLRS